MMRFMLRLLVWVAIVLGLSLPAMTQPLSEIHFLTAGNSMTDSDFGESVAISGDIAFIGDPQDDSMGFQAGAAYVFEHDAQTGTWAELEKLIASDPEVTDYFGEAVSVSGGVAFVAAPRDDDAATDAGAVYVFERDAQTGAWIEAEKLTASDAEELDRFGTAVAVEGDIALVGAPLDEAQAGAVYVFERDAQTGTWVEVQKLTASDPAAWDRFGWSVAIEGDVVVIGAYTLIGFGQRPGAAYVFERDAQTGDWTEVQKLVGSEGEGSRDFAVSVAVSGSTALVGTTRSDDPGSVYVFERVVQTGAWVEAQELIATNTYVVGPESDLFGQSVSLSGTVALIGAPDADHPGHASDGAAYVFERGTPAVTVTATADPTVAQGGMLTVAVTAQSHIGTAVLVHLVLVATGPRGQVVPRELAMGTLPAGATVSRTFDVAVGSAPVGLWTVAARVDRRVGPTLGYDVFVVEVTPSEATVAGPPFGPAEEVEPIATASAATVPVAASVTGPNPFRGRTTLAFTLAEAGAVRLTLHDALGREVAVLAAGAHAAGPHVVAVEAGALPSGVYGWRLSAGGRVTTGRMTLVR
jgi:hypothetical protein